MKTRTPNSLTLAALGLLALSPFAFAHGEKHHPDPGSSPGSSPNTRPASAPAAKKMVTVKGEVIDMGCYLGHGSKGAAHIKCAQMCVGMGMPIGLLAGDGTLYLLTMDHGDAKPYNAAKAKVGKVITAVGDIYEGSGMKALEIKKVTA